VTGLFCYQQSVLVNVIKDSAFMKKEHDIKKKILIFRLSSLGDVVLATSVLSVASVSNYEVHWVVARGFDGILQIDPRISKVWVFDRRDGLAGWILLCRKLWAEGFVEVWDLHASLRTWIARCLFFVWSLALKSDKKQLWKKVAKQRFRTSCYFLFKSLFPVRLRPDQMRSRFLVVADGDSDGNTDVPSLISRDLSLKSVSGIPEKQFICVMPSSAWAGKCWSVDNYFEVLSALPFVPVILGGSGDRLSRQLAERLGQSGRVYLSGVGLWSLSEVGFVLSKAVAYLGNDTGLAHLAEALGTRAFVLFGPTAPDAGFGPFLPASRAIGASLWCRPCGKDGRYCFRFRSRYRCIREIEVQDVIRVLKTDLVTTQV
jgi:heptosyltransferase-2